MRLVPTSRVPVGALIARDVQLGRPDGIPLLRRGVHMTERYRRGLLQSGIHAVYVDDELSEGINPEQLVSDETRTVATRAVAAAYEEATKTVSGQPLGGRAIAALSDVVERILLELENIGGAAAALADLCAADAYTFQHSVDVTALGLLIGRKILHERGWLDYKGERQYTRFDERLYQLGMGLLLHDVGKLAIPMEILRKPGRLTLSEWEMMKTHPRAGFELLRGTPLSPLVKSVVLRHHERWDGSGYPDGKQGTAIHEMARIAAVADVYDAMTSERTYDTAHPAHVGVRTILEGSDSLFDPYIVKVFSSLVAPFPPGVEVELIDGRHAIVVSAPEGAVDRPIVRVIDGPGAPYELSLEQDATLEIAGWDTELFAAVA